MVDLHVHTNCSDGTYDPSTIVEMAQQAGLQSLAITDHDTLDAYTQISHIQTEVQIIKGIEMTLDYDGAEIHLLGLHISAKDEGLITYTEMFKERRRVRGLQIIDKCRKLGYGLSDQEVEPLLSGKASIGRAHIARLLVASGYFPTVSAVFKTILGINGSAYIPNNKLSVQDGIELIHHAGGIAVVAHPIIIKQSLLDLLRLPVDGLEVYHPKQIGKYDEYRAMAMERGLMISGGSDFHGTPDRYPCQLGVFDVAEKWVEKIVKYR